MQFGKYVQPFRVTGGDLRLADHDPGDTGGLDLEKKEARELWRAAWNCSPTCRRASTPTTVGRSSSSSRRWTRRARTAPSSTSCPASTRRAARCTRSRFRRRTRSTTTCGAPRCDCPRAATSASSTAPTTRRCSSSACTRRFWTGRSYSALVGSRIFEERLEDIRSYERYLGRNGTAIIKFFLNVSKDEQKRRFLERIDNPEKHWKFALGDIEERKHWSAYMAAYEDAIRETATQDAPWYVVPADKKWFTRLVVAGAIIERLAQLGLEYPRNSEATPQQMAAARKALLSER